MAKPQPEEIKQYLDTCAQNEDIQSAKKYIEEHIDDICKIYYTYGSGNKYLRSAHDIICIKSPKFAVEYQDCLETLVAGDVLFSDE